MKVSHKLITRSLLPLTALAAISCTTITPETSSSEKIKQGVPGGEFVETSTINATVTAVNSKSRKVSMVTDQGKNFSVKAGPEVVNFPQIRVGDRLKVELTEELVVRMAKPGEKIEDGGETMIGLSTLGSKPGAMRAETYQVTATVVAIDEKDRKATLKFPDGSTKDVAVRKDIDLSKHKTGEKVIIRATEVFAISMTAS